MFIKTTGRQPVCQTFDQKANSLPVGKLEPAPAGKIKDGLYDARPVGQNQRFARLKVAAVEHDQGAAVCRPARHVGAIDATLQPGAVKGDIVGTEPFKTLAKRSLEKSAHGLRVRRGKLDIVDHVMPWFEDFMHGRDLPASPDFGRMLHQPDGSGQFTFAGYHLPVYGGHKKRGAFAPLLVCSN